MANSLKMSCSGGGSEISFVEVPAFRSFRKIFPLFSLSDLKGDGSDKKFKRSGIISRDKAGKHSTVLVSVLLCESKVLWEDIVFRVETFVPL